MTQAANNPTLRSMCLLAVAYRTTAEFPLVVSANRDEFYGRPSLALHWWKNAPILAGRDLRAGGTWMGVSKSGRFAAVTNYRRAEATPGELSRGALVADFLDTSDTACQWAEEIKPVLNSYGGFNLLVYDGSDLLYINNVHGSVKRLERGVFALSNHLLDTPWPKVELARSQLQNLLEAGSPSVKSLLELLKSQQTFAQHLLPDTGVSPELEQLLSSPFIVSDTYGTRASTALLVSNGGEITMAEQCFYRGKETEFREFNFNVS